MKHLLWVIVCFILVSSSAFAQASQEGQVSQEKIVFQKVFPQKQTLVVRRHEIPVVPPTPETLKRLPPGGSLEKPDHHYLYSFVLASPGKADKTVWVHEVLEYDSIETLYGKWQIFDAALEASNLIVTFKQAGDTYANIIKPCNGKIRYCNLILPPLARSRLLLTSRVA